MLEMRGLTKHFGGLSAVDGVDLNVNRGEVVGLIGPNGAGKTTAFNLITGFLRPNKGKVTFEGENIVGQKPHTIARKGLVRTFQTANLFNDLTVLQNIMAACYQNPKVGFWEAALHVSSSNKKQEAALHRALEITQFTGLDTVRDTTAGSLPHGPRRLLGIAMALATEPKLLLLDEPLSGMNAEEVDNAMKFIEKIRKGGVTILLIEHNMRAAMSLCQRIAVLNFGRKIAEGSPEEIKTSKDVIQAYLGASEYAA